MSYWHHKSYSNHLIITTKINSIRIIFIIRIGCQPSIVKNNKKDTNLIGVFLRIEAINSAPHCTFMFIDLFNRAHRKNKYSIFLDRTQ